MSEFHLTHSEEVEHLLRNAQLRDELEPFSDESLDSLNLRRVPTPIENDFLASMLAWERAPVVPIAEWFTPAMRLPPPESLDECELRTLLWSTIHKLFEHRIVLNFTDHLSDRQLYCLIYRDILPSPEKKLERRDNYLHWDCTGSGGDAEIWLRYYASEDERRLWLETSDAPLPPRQRPPYPRKLPRGPL